MGCLSKYEQREVHKVWHCSYGDQPTICGRSRAPRCPGRNDKDTPLRSDLLHSHFTALASTVISVMTSRRDGLCIRWCDLHQSDGETSKMSFSFTSRRE